MIKKLFLFLKSCGYDVFFANQDTSDVKNKLHLVIQRDSQYNNNTHKDSLYIIYICIPHNKYQEVDDYIKTLENNMKNLSEFRYNNHNTPTSYDDTSKVYYVGMQYLLMKV